MPQGPKILVLDIETAPILAYVWSLWDQNVGLNQIVEDWYVISWAAKWHGQKRVMQMDQRNARDLDDDKRILKVLWGLLNKADIIVTQNGKKFDMKKLNARFVMHGMKPHGKPKHIDTRELAKRHFGFTSNKLEYMTDKLCTKYKKLKHEKFQGFELWKECLARNMAAWKEMAKYNKYDVLSLEELYDLIKAWDTSVSFNVYHNGEHVICQCGHPAFVRNGFAYTAAGKYQKWQCKQCGAPYRDSKNLFPKAKRDSILRTVKG